MADARSTIRSRELGNALRHSMEQAGINGKQVAFMLDWSQSRVSRLLTGQLGATEVDVSAFLATCRVTGPTRDRLLRLAREQNTSGWLQQHGQRLPEQLKTLVDHENSAVEINGLLQTGDYAHAVISRIANIPADEVTDRVRARLGRQSLFAREHRPDFTFYLHESVLRLPVGGPAVMSEQLHNLLRMGVRPYISIRVIPAAYGAHAGTAGSCSLMEFAEFKPVVYVEEETAGHFLEEPAEIAAYRNIFAALANAALDERQSKDLIAGLAVELYGDGAAHHDRA